MQDQEEATALPDRNAYGWVSTDYSQRILNAIFPNYPILYPCNPLPNDLN